MTDKKYEGYLFGPILSADETGPSYSIIAKTIDNHAIELVKNGQRGMQASMKVIAFSCSICGKNYETCQHIAGENYEGSNCSALMSEWKPANIFLVSKSSDSRYRITDMLLVTEHKKKNQFVWYGFQADINSRKLHLMKVVSNNWIPREVFDHFIQIFHIAPLGIATFPPDPLPILERGYRIDLLQSPYEIRKKDRKDKNKNFSSKI